MNYGFMASLINNLLPAVEAISNTPSREIQMYEQ